MKTWAAQLPGRSIPGRPSGASSPSITHPAGASNSANNAADFIGPLCGDVFLANDGSGTPDDTRIATEATFWSVAHEAPIDRTASGGLVAQGTRAWTGTTATGMTSSGQHCQNWNTGAGTDGRVGSPRASDAEWNNHSSPDCDNAHRVYCIETF